VGFSHRKKAFHYSSELTYFSALIITKKNGSMRHAFILLILLFSFSLPGQIKVSGLITASDTGEALIAANVKIQGEAAGTVTDLEGRFELNLPANGSIEVSYIGYKMQVIKNLEDGQHLIIELEPGEVVSTTIPLIRAPATPVELEVAAPIMRIPRRHLEREEEVSITASLNRIPGVYMQSGALNTNRITIRGIGNRSLFSTAKIRAYLDEIPLTSGVGETTIEDLDLSLIESVDVWKGPTASTYGAGLGGMINLKSINTKEDNLNTNLRLQTTYGSFGLQRNLANFQYVNPKQTGVLNLNYNRLKSDGYRDNNNYDRDAFSLLGKVQSGANNTLTLFANYTRLKAFIPSSINRDDYLNEPTKAAFTWGRVMGFEDSDKLLIGLANQHDFGESKNGLKWSNTTSLFTTYRDAYELRPFNILEESSVAVGGRSKFTVEKQVSNDYSFDLNVGAELFNEDYDWQLFDVDQRDSLIGDNQETRQYYNLFLEFNQKLGNKLRISAGLNFNNTSYDYTDLYLQDGTDQSGDYSFDPVLSPRLGLSYFLKPRLMLFAVVSHGFSPPTLEETLTPDGTINPDIQPEKGWNFELGSRGHYLNQRFSYELTFYTMRINDLLVARRTAADQFVGINAGKTTHTGIEAFAQYQISSYPKRLEVYVAYHFADYTFNEFVDGDRDYSMNDLTGQAPHKLNLGLDYSPYQYGFYGNANFQFVDAFPMRDDNSVFSDAYSVLNAKIGYKKGFAKNWEIDLSAGVNNILDEKYASMILINAGSFGGAEPRYYYPGLPRNYYGSLRVTYKFR
jgi:iron complex outermembrane receptor protein